MTSRVPTEWRQRIHMLLFWLPKGAGPYIVHGEVARPMNVRDPRQRGFHHPVANDNEGAAA